MAVLIDVVFNHTGENMEGRQQQLTFNGIDKWYYYRLDENGEHIGAFGNEVKSENRPMTQRWLLDQLRHFVDGSASTASASTSRGRPTSRRWRWIESELGEDVLIYGEPWIGSPDPDYEANPDWDWYKADSPITFFQDDARNAFKGPTSDPTPEATLAASPAVILWRGRPLCAPSPTIPERPRPSTGINYLDIHDNWALADQFASCETGGDCAWDGRAGVREAEMRIAAALLLTSLGPVVIHGGTEIARSKGLAPLPEAIGGQLVKTEMPLAPIYIKGRGDTYNLRAANRFQWETVGDASGAVDFSMRCMTGGRASSRFGSRRWARSSASARRRQRAGCGSSRQRRTRRRWGGSWEARCWSSSTPATPLLRSRLIYPMVGGSLLPSRPQSSQK